MSKLPNVEQLKNGKWRYRKRIRVGGQVVPLQSLGIFATDIEAFRALGEALEYHKAKGAAPRPSAQPESFGVLAEQWWATELPRYCEASTRQDYRGILDCHILPALGDLRVDRISRGMVAQFLKAKLAGGLSFSRVNYLKACVSGVFKWAQELDQVESNPALGISLRARKKETDPDSKRIRPFTKGEIATILADNKLGQADRALLMVGARAGLRISEIFGLKWQDVDFARGKLVVSRQRYRGQTLSPKSGRYREVDISEQLADTLKRWRAQAAQSALAAGREPVDWVFYTRTGTPYLYSNWARSTWLPLMRRLGLGGHSPHDLRHSFASHLLAAGVGVHYVAAQLGHHNVSVTLKFYAHWIPRPNEGQTNLLDDPLPRVATERVGANRCRG